MAASCHVSFDGTDAFGQRNELQDTFGSSPYRCDLLLVHSIHR